MIQDAATLSYMAKIRQPLQAKNKMGLQEGDFPNI